MFGVVVVVVTNVDLSLVLDLWNMLVLSWQGLLFLKSNWSFEKKETSWQFGQEIYRQLSRVGFGVCWMKEGDEIYEKGQTVLFATIEQNNQSSYQRKVLLEEYFFMTS